MVGDEELTDVTVARIAGLKSVKLDRGPGAEGHTSAAARVQSLDEIAWLVGRL